MSMAPAKPIKGIPRKGMRSQIAKERRGEIRQLRKNKRNMRKQKR